jgi:hypothetical protein
VSCPVCNVRLGFSEEHHSECPESDIALGDLMLDGVIRDLIEDSMDRLNAARAPRERN